MHLEVHQSKDGGEDYICHLCPKKFKSKVYLQKHLERHENKKRRKKKRKMKKEGEESNSEDVKAEDGSEMDANGDGDTIGNGMLFCI